MPRKRSRRGLAFMDVILSVADRDEDEHVNTASLPFELVRAVRVGSVTLVTLGTRSREPHRGRGPVLGGQPPDSAPWWPTRRGHGRGVYLRRRGSAINDTVPRNRSDVEIDLLRASRARVMADAYKQRRDIE